MNFIEAFEAAIEAAHSSGLAIVTFSVTEDGMKTLKAQVAEQVTDLNLEGAVTFAGIPVLVDTDNDLDMTADEFSFTFELSSPRKNSDYARNN